MIPRPASLTPVRFFFLKRVWPKPSGGHKHIRLLASVLNSLGASAELVFIDKPGDPDCDFGIDVPVAPFEIAAGPGIVGKNDVAVLPESYVMRYLDVIRSWPCRKAVLIQNGYFALRSRPPGGYARNGIDFAIVTTPALASVARAALGMPGPKIITVPCWVDRAPFLPDPAGASRSPTRVCYMPRKLPGHAAGIRARVARERPDVAWEPIDGASEEDVAAAFRRSAVFLSTQDKEGFGLPAIEAMNCGCLVAGYAGTGRFPHPYANPENGFWAPDRSMGRAAAQLCKALDAMQCGDETSNRIIAAGQRTAAIYSEKAFQEAARGLLAAAEGEPVPANTAPFAKLGFGGWLEILKILVMRRSRKARGRRVPAPKA